jgi:hypothetical protein
MALESSVPDPMKYIVLLVPDIRIERMTYRLQGGCSTPELIRRNRGRRAARAPGGPCRANRGYLMTCRCDGRALGRPSALPLPALSAGAGSASGGGAVASANAAAGSLGIAKAKP